MEGAREHDARVPRAHAADAPRRVRRVPPMDRRRTVRRTLSLFEAAGYSCFWVLLRALVPATGACWLSVFDEQPKWSNMLCAHEPPVVAALHTIAREAYEARRANRTRAGA